MRKSTKEKAVVSCLGLILLLGLFPSSAHAALTNTIYQPRGYWDYNGSTKGYIMSYGATGTERQYMRVAFSVDRPAYHIGDHILTYIRTDGYWYADSGWWYQVPGASVSISYYYPNGTKIGSTISSSTDSFGIYKNETALRLGKNYPMGRYKANATVTGPSAGRVSLSGVTVGGSTNEAYLTVFFDVGSNNLNVSITNIPDRVKKNTLVGINGTVYQPNGQVFNNTGMGLGSFSYPVNISVQYPNGTFLRLDQTTTTGGFSQSFTPDKVGTYYVLAFVDYSLGNEVLRGRYSMGRKIEKFVVEGDWPEVGLGFDQSLASIASLLGALYFFRRRV